MENRGCRGIEGEIGFCQKLLRYKRLPQWQGSAAGSGVFKGGKGCEILARDLQNVRVPHSTRIRNHSRLALPPRKAFSFWLELIQLLRGLYQRTLAVRED
jgi:hypothetical protein